MWMNNSTAEGGTAAERGIEADGAAGAGEPQPATISSGMSDEGQYNTAAQQAHAAKHGRPAISETPDNLTGEIESSGPNKAEGDIGIQQYPHQGPPARTTSAGGSGNPFEGDGEI
jgi:hypothetical protein